jgi:hypothetical protein
MSKVTQPIKLARTPWRSEHDADGDFAIFSADDELLAVTNADTERDEAHAGLFSAAPDLYAFIERQSASMNCICKGAMGRVQKLMKTDVPCTKCEGEMLLAKARGENV